MLGFDRILYLYDFIRPFLDIAVMTFILYKAYDFISKTNGVQMLKSLLIVVIVAKRPSVFGRRYNFIVTLKEVGS